MSNYDKYRKLLATIADLRNAAALLGWDQETFMPPKGASGRSRQLATLATTAHNLFTSNELYDLVNELLQTDLNHKERRNVERTLYDLNKERRFSSDFVQQLSEAVSNAYVNWSNARIKNDYKIFQPALERIIDLKKEESRILNIQGHPYNGMLDNFEPGLSVEQLDQLFQELKSELKPLTDQIRIYPQVRNDFMFRHFDENSQWEYGSELIKSLGFDIEAGRQDKSIHPFTTNFNSKDVRITSRTNSNDLNEMIWSTIHECGHALYEQGLPYDEYGLPSGQYLSLSVHESQSRLYENNLGRSLVFWKVQFPHLQKRFENLSDVGPTDFFKAMNKVGNSLIRTNADELTYHFHIIIRYEIEKMLFDGSASVSDLPELWNSKYNELLGTTPKHDNEGILQDIHWSHGSFGYFPTYTLGSLYASQFMETIEKNVPDIIVAIEGGDYGPLLTWLRENIHSKGKTPTADELCIETTGRSLSIDPFMNYVTKKYAQVYNMS